MLEGFQAGLSWRTILHRREGFRAAFARFDPDKVAAFDDTDIARLMADARIIRARAKINASLDPEVVCAQHGWWQACEELGLPGYPPYGPDSANLNLVLPQTPSDPISGSSPMRATVCDVSAAK